MGPASSIQVELHLYARGEQFVQCCPGSQRQDNRCYHFIAWQFLTRRDVLLDLLDNPALGHLDPALLDEAKIGIRRFVAHHRLNPQQRRLVAFAVFPNGQPMCRKIVVNCGLLPRHACLHHLPIFIHTGQTELVQAVVRTEIERLLHGSQRLADVRRGGLAHGRASRPARATHVFSFGEGNSPLKDLRLFVRRVNDK